MAISKGLNNSNLKAENRGLVLKMIATGQARTRIELAKKCGLSKMSLTNIVNEFMKAHIVKETEIEKVKGAGRNPVVLTITDRCKKVIGLSINRNQVSAVLTDISNEVIKRSSQDINADNAADLEKIIIDAIEDVSSAYERKDILGIGVSSIGPVNINDGVILNPSNFYGIENFEIKRILEDRYGLPVFVDNEYSCAALIEKYFGVGKHYSDFVFVGIEKLGVGSGIVVNDEILHSAGGKTPELGHISIDYNGKKCACGNKGCLELYAASDKLRIKLMFATGKDLSFKDFCNVADSQFGNKKEAEDLDVENMFNEEQLRDIDMIFNDAASAIASACTSAVNLLHPDAIIIGHDGFYLPANYVRKIQDDINTVKVFSDSSEVTVIKSAFEREAQILGAATLVIDAAFKGIVSV